MPHTERVVIANLTQCYHCHRLIRPQEGVQRRQVVTGGAIGRTRWRNRTDRVREIVAAAV